MHSHESYQAAIWLVALNSNSETHMTVICDARLVYGRGGFHGPVFICGGTSFH